MTSRLSNDLAIAAAAAAFAILFAGASLAEEKQLSTGTTIPAAKTDGGPDAAANALKRGSAPPGIAGRGADRGCREQAARLKLFGLGRHKFLQRCRRAARRKAPTR